MTSVVITSIIAGTVFKLALIGGGVKLLPDVLHRLQIGRPATPSSSEPKKAAAAPAGTSQPESSPDQQVPRAA